MVELGPEVAEVLAALKHFNLASRMLLGHKFRELGQSANSLTQYRLCAELSVDFRDEAREHVADILLEVGDLEAAAAQYRDLQDELACRYGPTHVKTLGVCLSRIRCEQALQQGWLVDELADLHGLVQRELGARHTLTTNVRRALLQARGMSGEADDALEELDDLARTALRENDTSRFVGLRRTAASIARRANWNDEALALLREALDRREALTQGTTRTLRVDEMNLLGKIMPAEALEHVERLLLAESVGASDEEHYELLLLRVDTARKVLPPEDVLMLAQQLLAAVPVEESDGANAWSDFAVGRVARAYAEAGTAQLGLNILHHLVSMQRRSLGPLHRRTLKNDAKYATLLFETGQVAAALAEFNRLVGLAQSTYGAADAQTLINRASLAKARGALGDYVGAVQDLEAIIADASRRLIKDTRGDELQLRVWQQGLEYWTRRAAGEDLPQFWKSWTL